MDVQAFAERSSRANTRMMAAAGRIAALMRLPAPALTGASRNPQYAALFEREAVADFLDALAERLEAPETPQVSASEAPARPKGKK